MLLGLQYETINAADMKGMDIRIRRRPLAVSGHAVVWSQMLVAAIVCLFCTCYLTVLDMELLLLPETRSADVPPRQLAAALFHGYLGPCSQREDSAIVGTDS